jgi:beta-xylosidase
MKKNLLITITLLLLLSACGAPANAPQAPSIPPQAATIAPAAPATETSAPPTVAPSPTPDPLLFSDHFDGALGEGWHWLREKNKYWSLTKNPGWLQIMASGGGIGDGVMPNVLLREAPKGNFELETLVNFRPVGRFQIAGLLIYESNGHFVQFGRAAGPKDGLYLDRIADGQFTGGNFATTAPDVDALYLRLRREANTFTAWYSEDGQTWTAVGAHQDSMNPLFVGLLAGQAVQSVPKPAQFDYFTMTAIQ